MSVLQVEHVGKSYPTPAEDLLVLRDVSFSMDRGENLAIVGPSGSGKSTLLHILGTLDRPSQGTVKLNDQDPFKLDDTSLAAFRNKNIGFVFQDHHLLPHLSVLENVLVPALATKSIDKETEQRAIQLLDRVGLANRKTHLPSELSGGERERVAVARALLLKPTLLLADEPTGNLDAANAQKVASLLLDLQKEEQSILIVVTHSLELASQMSRQWRMDQQSSSST